MVSNTTISQRLAITFGIVLIMFAAVAGIVSYRASDVTAASEIIRDRTLPKVRAVNRMQDAMCRRAFKFDHLCALNFDQG